MVDTIVFHIGDHKTGTTSLQRTLAQKRWRCDSVPLFYPSRLHSNALATFLSNPEKFDARAERFLNLLKKMDSVKTGVGVVSAEEFENVEARVFKDTLETYLPNYAAKARVIAYVRPHAERLVSSWAEQIKLGSFTGSFDAFFENSLLFGGLGYHDRFMEWREAFGDRFILRPMVRNRLYKNSVIQDFLRFALKTDDFTVDEVRENASMTVQDLALLKLLHEGFPKHSIVQANIGRLINPILASLPPRSISEKPKLPHILAPKIIAAYQDDAQNLDRDFFKGTPMLNALKASLHKTTTQSLSVKPEDHFSCDEIRSIQALAAMIASLATADEIKLQKHLRQIFETSNAIPLKG